jgi:hypothetical protein
VNDESGPGFTYPGQPFTVDPPPVRLTSGPPHMGWRPAEPWEVPVLARAYAAAAERDACLVRRVSGEFPKLSGEYL